MNMKTKKKNVLKERDNDRLRYQFVFCHTSRNKKEWIAWAENEIKEYQKFIKLLTSEKNMKNKN